MLAGLVSVVVATATLIAISPSTASAAENTLMFWPSQDMHKTFGPNAVIRIDGTLDYDAACDDDGSRPGIDDFLYPATDVYVVPTGSVGGIGAGLTDAAGGGPNTIVAQASHVFIDEVIAITAPGGTLGEGVYDVVYDTCQDGALGPEDEIFYEAITVEFPEGDLPPVDASITRLKDAAREQYASWLETHTVLTALFKADKAAEFLKCFVAPDPACLSVFLYSIYDVDQLNSVLNNPIEARVMNLVYNVAQNHGAIWKDPPDPDFAQPTTLGAIAQDPVPAAGAALTDALSGLVAPLTDEAALTEGLLHAIERYQGAQAAGNSAWALGHAREVRDLSATLAERLASTDAVEQLRDEFAANEDAIEAHYDEGRLAIRRLRTSGFTGTERRHLANAGLDNHAISALEAQFVARGDIPTYVEGTFRKQINQVVNARTKLKAALDETVAGWEQTIAALELRVKEQDRLPVANAGGSYAGTAGISIVLDGSGSTAGAQYAWDLDADGAFDDATGVNPSATFARSTIVGLKVTTAKGSAVDYAVVTVTGADQAPVINGREPAAATTVVVGTPQTFSVDATDPDGDALSYAWTLDGDAAGTDATFTYDPAADAVGAHVLSLVVTGARERAVASWRISVELTDADNDGWSATSDCDDTRTDVHPSGYERFGNGIDDDCDPGTMDAPPGGLTGTVWSWGSQQALGKSASTTQYAPAPVPSIGEAVQIEAGHAVGYAVFPDGTVKAWGQNFNGGLGNGTQTASTTPVVVQNVGGGGTLTGVTEIATDREFVLARRSDGSVVAWGWNSNGQVGDMSSTTNRLFPSVVVDANGTPITGVAHVETGEFMSMALMEDGTVMHWGQLYCDGTIASERTNYAVPAPTFGTGNVQLSSGDNGWVLARKADGAVWACGTLGYLLNRSTPNPSGAELYTPRPMLAFPPGSGIVDVAAGASTGVALREDGTVFTWGRNINHELDVIGVPLNGIQAEPTPVPLPPGPPVIDVEQDDSQTIFATRADGSVLVWGANTNGAAGIGNSASFVPGIAQLAIDGNVVKTESSSWNGLALVRPADDPTWERPAQYITASVADTELGEATGGVFTVTLSQPAHDDLTVTWAIEGGASGTATIPKGATSVDIPVTIVDDDIDEDDEAIAFQIVDISHGITIEDGTAIGTVIDDDEPPAFSVSSTTVDEGDTSLTDVVLKVSLSAPSGKDTSVQYATVDGSATAPDDYTASAGTIEIPAGETQATIHVAVRGDRDVETEESFAVVLTDPVNATLGDATGAVVVKDDEPMVLDVTSPTVLEGDSGTTPATFVVETTAPPAGTTITVPWSIVGGTAEIGVDVEAASGTLTFDAATTTQLVTVNVIGDEVVEPLAIENFRLLIGEASASDGRAVLRSDAQPASIIDDDTESSMLVVDAGEDVNGVEGTPITITGNVTADGPVTTTWVAADARCAIADPTALTTTVTCSDDVVTQVVLTADDGTATANDSATVTVVNADPTVVITAPAPGTEVAAGETFAVTAEVTDPGASDIVTCTVDFGDGAPVANGCEVTHAYTGSGSFTITVVATDDDGGSATATTAVAVAESAPVVDAGVDVHGVEGVPVALAGTVFDDDPVTTKWTISDPRCTIANPAALSTTVTCTDNLVAVATLTANDGSTTASDTTTVTIANVAPSVRIDAPADGTDVSVGTTIALRTTVADVAGDTVRCVVDWGDGSAPSTGCAPSHRFGEQGVFTITVTATDDDGASSEATTTIIVTSTSAKNALVVGAGRLASNDVTVGGLVVPILGVLRLGLVGGTYTDASGHHAFGAIGADGFSASKGTATWSATGLLDGRKTVKITITVTDGGKAATDHVKLTIKGTDGKVLLNADGDVRYGGFTVR